MDQQQSVSPEEYERMIKAQCPFCKIVSGEIPAMKVYEDSKTYAFLDINPASPGHTLVVPKKHYTVLPQVPDSDVGHIFKVVRNITGLLFEITQRSSPDKPAGVNVIQNNGASAGQQVPHLHIHIIPRIEGDNVIQPWQPKKMEEDQLKQFQSILSANIKPVVEGSSSPKEVAIPGISQPAIQPATRPESQQVPQPQTTNEQPKPSAPKSKKIKRKLRVP